MCNGCEAVIATVPAADLQKTFDELELTLDVASEVCPHCGAINLFPGLSKVLAFTSADAAKNDVPFQAFSPIVSAFRASVPQVHRLQLVHE